VKPANREAVGHVVARQDFLPPVADRQQVVEFDPGEVVEALALDEVALARAVASGVLVGEVRIAVDVALDLAEIADRGERINEQLVEPGRAQILPGEQDQDHEDDDRVRDLVADALDDVQHPLHRGRRRCA
jgi:hypothetical protein